MAIDVLAPPLGQTTDTVVLANWYKQEGDSVTQGEILFAIETDKATLDVEATASGILRGVKAKVGDVVQVLSSIASIVQPGEEQQRRIFISPRARRLAEQENIPLAALHATGPEGAIIESDIRAYLEQSS